MLFAHPQRFRWFFVALSILEIASNFLRTDFPTLHYVAKPTMLIVLGGYFFVQTVGMRTPRTWLMQAALAFAWLGDVFLMFDGTTYFQLGLGSFLLMQVGYTLVFRNTRQRATPSYGLLALVCAFALGVLLLIWPNLGAMRLPVVVYLLAIAVMVLTTLFRRGKVPAQSFWWVFGGAVLFMISDSLIAIEKFYGPVPLREWWVMSTYLAAQYLIVEGLLLELRKQPN